MIKEQAEMLQEDLRDVCKANGIVSGFGFFADKVGQAMLFYHNIGDNDIMYMINNLVIRIAEKQKISPYEVLEKLKNGIHPIPDNPEKN